MSRRVVWILGLLAVAGCGSSEPSGLQFLAVLSGGNEVPPQNTVLAGATASFTANGSEIAYEVNVQNITGVTDAGIYIGAAGVIGPKVADLYEGATSGPITAGTLSNGTFSASALTALSLDSLLTLMHNGGAYVNILTTSLPTGEVRGQIHPN